MNKKFLTKVVLATVLVGGVNLLPLPNFDLGNVQISVAYAENKNFAAKEGAMTDVELIEAQAKEASRMRAIEAVKEKIASYVRNFSGAKGKLSEDDIAAIAEKFEEVGETKYKKLFYNAVDEEGKELGKVGIMYEATVTAKFNSKKITEHIKLTEQEKAKRIRQAKESRAKFEELDREYEELRKNARTKTPEQLQSEIKDFDDKISDLEKSRNKNKSAKKDKPTTKQDKIQPMKFSNPVKIGEFGFSQRSPEVYITGASYVNERPNVNGRYFKGMARFGEGNDALYLHYDFNSRPCKIGSDNAQNAVIYDFFWSSIFKIKVNNGHTMYFISKNYDVPEPRKQYMLIGRRPDGKWVKYFDTDELCSQYIGKNTNVAIQKIIANGDTIIAQYARCNNPKDSNFYASKANEFGEFRFKWDEAAKWFGVEKITYNQKPTEQKPAQENKPVTNQPMQFSQPVKLGSASAINAEFYVYEVKGAFFNKNGVSKFGDNQDFICFYQRPATTNYSYGGTDIKNTFPFLSAYGCEFTQIKTNKNLTLYMVHEWEFDFSGEKYILIGKRQDGVFVKYFDTRELTTKYFGKPQKRSQIPYYKYWNCNGDSISIVYQRIRDRQFVNEGEFRFKWDDKAQWFSVEQIKY